MIILYNKQQQHFGNLLDALLLQANGLRAAKTCARSASATLVSS